jgi:ParB/RepB/Spo0J family partition protein
MTRAQLLASTRVPQDALDNAGPHISKFELLPTAALTPHPRNPRKHTREQIRAIARSIEAFGFNAPILIDKDKKIVAGHGRYEAAKYLGYAQVPVIWLNHLSEAQARAYMLADNKLTDRSSWDDAALAAHLKELSELTLEFDIDAIGFEAAEIDFHIQSLNPPEEEADRADEFDVSAGPEVSRTGDLWILNGHRLYCGNALDAASYEVLFGLDKASAVITDPPYNRRINGDVSGKGAIKHPEFAMASGEMNSDEFRQFLTASLKLTSAYTSSGSVIYTFMDWRHIDEILTAGRAQGWEFANLCVWVKSNGGMGSFYRSMHELVFVFRQGGGKSVNNIQLGRFGRNRTNVWNYPGANSFARKGTKRNLDIHPTTKPIALVADAILDSTQRDDIVLDPFLGSGTTILAAHRTARRCYGIEIDPIYVDTAIQRWEKLTGKLARHVSGATFTEIRNDRTTRT